MTKKKKKYQSAKAVGGLVVGATGTALIGSAMPGTTGTALLSASSGFSSMVGPGVTALGAGMVVKQLRHFPKPRRRRRRYK